VEFDPTPPASEEGTYFVRLSSQWLDALDSFWTDVITFDRIGQVTLFQSTGRELFRFLANSGQLLARLRLVGKGLTDEFLTERLSNLILVFWVLPAGLIVFALGYRYRRYLRLFLKRRVFRQGAEHLAPEYYLELLEVLKRRGFRRAQSETPLEFASRIRTDLDSNISACRNCITATVSVAFRSARSLGV
jgi:hypothetical protein